MLRLWGQISTTPKKTAKFAKRIFCSVVFMGVRTANLGRHLQQTGVMLFIIAGRRITLFTCYATLATPCIHSL
jgi:hypothetical protein